MTPINMGLALFLSCIIPGLGLWNIEYGKLYFLSYAVSGFLLFVLAILSFGLGFVLFPILWLSSLFHTWFLVRHHNRQAAKEAGIAQQFAELHEQVQNLSS